MQLGHLMVITLEKSQKVFRQITFIGVVKRTNDAEINSDVFRHSWIFDIDKEITGMHVSMKKVMREYLREKYFHTHFRQPFHVGVFIF